MSKQDIKHFFEAAGEVIDVYFPRDDNRPHKGYVFIQMGSIGDAMNAIRKFHQELDPFNRELIVRLADFRKNFKPTKPKQRLLRHDD